MRIFARNAGLYGLLLALSWSVPAAAADLTLAGDIGISSLTGNGTGSNDFVNRTDAGESDDETPVYGAALGVALPLNELVTRRIRLQGFEIPYWPGRALRFEGRDGVQLPDWVVRFEAEYIRGRDAELSTDSFDPLAPYRADLESWSVMGKLRMDVPIRTPVEAIAGRVPFLEPLTLYAGGGAGLGVTDLDVSTGLLVGDESKQGFAWQAIAGFGYALNERVSWSVGWRYIDLGTLRTRLVDSTATNRGNYKVDLDAHEFSTSLSFAFWRIPGFGRD